MNKQSIIQYLLRIICNVIIIGGCILLITNSILFLQKQDIKYNKGICTIKKYNDITFSIICSNHVCMKIYRASMEASFNKKVVTLYKKVHNNFISESSAKEWQNQYKIGETTMCYYDNKKAYIQKPSKISSKISIILTFMIIISIMIIILYNVLLEITFNIINNYFNKSKINNIDTLYPNEYQEL